MPLGQRPLDRRNADKLSIFTPKGHLHAGLRTTDGECPRNGAFKVSDPGGGAVAGLSPRPRGMWGCTGAGHLQLRRAHRYMPAMPLLPHPCQLPLGTWEGSLKSYFFPGPAGGRAEEGNLLVGI